MNVEVIVCFSVLNNIVAADMKSAGSRRLQSERLLSFIFSNNDQIYDVFVYTLQQTHQSHLAEVIMQHSTCSCHRITNSPSTELLSSSENMGATSCGGGAGSGALGGLGTSSGGVTGAVGGLSMGGLSSVMGGAGVGMAVISAAGAPSSSNQLNGVCYGVPPSIATPYAAPAPPTSSHRTKAPIPPPPPPPQLPSSRMLGCSSPTGGGSSSMGPLSIHNPNNSLIMHTNTSSPPPMSDS